jgi:hypothetical protein
MNMNATHERDQLVRIGVLLGGIGLLLIGVAAIVFVLRGPPMSAQERVAERMAKEIFLPEMRKRMDESELPPGEDATPP